MRIVGRLLDRFRLLDDLLGVLLVLHVAHVQLVEARLQLVHLAGGHVGPVVRVVRFLVNL